MPQQTIEVVEYTGPLIPTELLDLYPLVLLGQFSSPQSDMLADNDGTLSVTDTTSTFGGDTLTYVGSGTATPGLDAALGFLALGPAVPVVVFEANGETYFHYPEGYPNVLGALVLSLELTTASAEVFTNPFIGTSGPDDFTGDAFGNTMIGNDGDDTISGEDGNDDISGNDGNDILSGGNGNDVIRGGAGNDRLSGGAGNDIIIGEGGIDFVSYEQATSGVNVDLRISDGQYISADQGVDRLTSIENVLGSIHDDRLVGDGGTNVLYGGRGSDMLYGLGGDDRLDGGLGSDRLWGGAGNDSFFFNSVAHSTNASQDTIHDFGFGDDLIVLRDIDANTTALGDQDFTFVGSNVFSGTAGELRFVTNGTHGFILGDVDGDGAADLNIALLNTTELTVDDLIL